MMALITEKPLSKVKLENLSFFFFSTTIAIHYSTNTTPPLSQRLSCAKHIGCLCAAISISDHQGISVINFYITYCTYTWIILFAYHKFKILVLMKTKFYHQHCAKIILKGLPWEAVKHMSHKLHREMQNYSVIIGHSEDINQGKYRKYTGCTICIISMRPKQC